jgi:hypothetical protein
MERIPIGKAPSLFRLGLLLHRTVSASEILMLKKF